MKQCGKGTNTGCYRFCNAWSNLRIPTRGRVPDMTDGGYADSRWKCIYVRPEPRKGSTWRGCHKKQRAPCWTDQLPRSPSSFDVGVEIREWRPKTSLWLRSAHRIAVSSRPSARISGDCGLSLDVRRGRRKGNSGSTLGRDRHQYRNLRLNCRSDLVGVVATGLQPVSDALQQ